MRSWGLTASMTETDSRTIHRTTVDGVAQAIETTIRPVQLPDGPFFAGDWARTGLVAPVSLESDTVLREHYTVRRYRGGAVDRTTARGLVAACRAGPGLLRQVRAPADHS